MSRIVNFILKVIIIPIYVSIALSQAIFTCLFILILGTFISRKQSSIKIMVEKALINFYNTIRNFISKPFIDMLMG